MDAPELTAERENAQGTIFNVKFSHSEPGTTIYYTTDGSDPTLESDSVLNNWNSTRQIEEGTIVRAFAYQENMASSEVTSFKVVDEKSPSSVQPPVINFKKENQYSADYEVLFSSPEISSETQSSVIYYYTLDGSTPNTNSKSTVCANAIVVQKGTTVKVIAKYAGFPISECSTATINDDSIQEKLEIPGIKLIRINTDSIEFNVSFNHQAITSQILDDITFYYTMDGSNPTLNSSSIRYSDNILITAEDGTVIKVFAGSDGLIYSEIASYTVSDEKSPSTIKPPTINFNRLNKYSSSFEVDFSSPEINSSAQKYVKYYYTTDGTNPSLISSSVNYNTPIIVSEGTIINVIAQYANFSPSDYSIKNIKTESQPEKIEPPILKYEKIADWAWEYNITVTHPAIIKGILDDLTFFYTTDGSIPTVNSKSFNYSDNKTLSMIEMNTIKVFACYEGTNKSDIISFKVGISSGPQVEPNPY